jgi:anti-sigma B factor antagonist
VRISIRFEEDVAVMTLEGKFTAGVDGPFLKEKTQDLLNSGVRKLVVNLAGVPYIDSTGLGFLASARRSAQEADAEIILAVVPPHVLKIIERVQLTQFFRIVNDDVEALKLFAQPSWRSDVAKAT